MKGYDYHFLHIIFINLITGASNIKDRMNAIMNERTALPKNMVSYKSRIEKIRLIQFYNDIQYLPQQHAANELELLLQMM